jgi:hypothetical protein
VPVVVEFAFGLDIEAGKEPKIGDFREWLSVDPLVGNDDTGNCVLH